MHSSDFTSVRATPVTTTTSDELSVPESELLLLERLSVCIKYSLLQ